MKQNLTSEDRKEIVKAIVAGDRLVARVIVAAAYSAIALTVFLWVAVCLLSSTSPLFRFLGSVSAWCAFWAPNVLALICGPGIDDDPPPGFMFSILFEWLLYASLIFALLSICRKRGRRRSARPDPSE
jgi:hypothetical protein